MSEFAADAQADRVHLTWQTRHEIGLTGFHIYRGVDEAGPGDRITAEPLPAQGAGSPQGYAYSYDDVPSSDRPVYYWLEEVRSDGATIRHGPVRVGETSFRLFLPVISVAQSGNAGTTAATDAVNALEAPAATDAVETGETPDASEPVDAVETPDATDGVKTGESPDASESAEAVETPDAETEWKPESHRMPQNWQTLLKHRMPPMRGTTGETPDADQNR